MIDAFTHIRNAIGVLGRNYVLGLPTALSGLALAFLSLPILGDKPEELSRIGALMTLGLTMSFIAQGVTVLMALDVARNGRTSLLKGISLAWERIGSVLILSMLMTILILCGFILFIAPGLLAYFLLFYSFPAMSVEGAGPFAAVRQSFLFIRRNLRDTLMVFLWVMSVGLLLGGINLLIGEVPVAGQLIGVVLSGAYGGFSAVMLISTYNELKSRLEVPAEPAQ